MKEVDFDKIVDVCDELATSETVLPLFIRCLIMEKWSKHLVEVGLYDEIIQESIKTKPHTYDDAVKELSDWCKQNKEYTDLIK